MKLPVRIIVAVIALSLLAGILSSCGSVKDNNTKTDSDKISVVATIFPEYDWARNILGDNSDNVDLTLLLNNGVDLHSFQPSAEDMIKISSCDVLIYVGGVSDSWIDDALKNASNKDMVVINLLEILGDNAKKEEVIEGMEAENEPDESEYDEHVWLSVKNASLFVSEISDVLSKVDEPNSSSYNSNAASYIEKLNAIDSEYQSTVDSAKKDTLLFGDRFPFRYMVDDYNLKYYAAFPGCSAESEASFETIAFLSEKVDELNLSAVLALEGSNQDIANAIVSAAKKKDTKILLMDSMQSITKENIENGITYLSIMEKNLNVLKEALN